jgi:hypothetical protein
MVMGRTLALFLRPARAPGERRDRRRSPWLAGLAWGLVALGALGAACGLAPVGGSKIRVQSELLPWANVSSYHTYRWWTAPIVESSGRYAEREPKLDWRVRQEVDAALAARGYVQATARPDFVVTYASVSEDYTSSFQDYVAYRAEGGTQDMGKRIDPAVQQMIAKFPGEGS